jgi:hypothetical protein
MSGGRDVFDMSNIFSTAILLTPGFGSSRAAKIPLTFQWGVSGAVSKPLLKSGKSNIVIRKANNHAMTVVCPHIKIFGSPDAQELRAESVR